MEKISRFVKLPKDQHSVEVSSGEHHKLFKISGTNCARI